MIHLAANSTIHVNAACHASYKLKMQIKLPEIMDF